MHAGKNYSFAEVLFWTRRDITALMVIAAIPTCCFRLLGWKWLILPWLPIALLGTAVAFAVGFRNNATYDRMWEARRVWGSIVNASRGFGIMVRDYVTNRHAARKLSPDELAKLQQALILRHCAWLTALRFQLREARPWEAIYEPHNKEFKDRWFRVEEQHGDLQTELARYLSPAELAQTMLKTNKTAYILASQSEAVRSLHDLGHIEDFRHMEMERMLVELYNHQGACERIKNFPYPRQYATMNLYFIKIFVFLVPFGMLQEFDKVGSNMVWLTIPFSALSGWIFTTMEKIGEGTESPFEGSANDVPITAMSRNIEIEFRELFGMADKPTPLPLQHNILM